MGNGEFDKTDRIELKRKQTGEREREREDQAAERDIENIDKMKKV